MLEEDATAYCESEVEQMSERLEKLDEDEATMLAEHAELTKVTHATFEINSVGGNVAMCELTKTVIGRIDPIHCAI